LPLAFRFGGTASSNAGEVQRREVTPETVLRLPSGKNYVVDLTRRNVIYDLNSTARAIDFSRVVVRTPTGEEPIASWLEKTFSKEALIGWESGRLRIGTLRDFRKIRGLPTTGQRLPTGSIAFECNPLYCVCRGDRDCNDMFSTNVCGAITVCVNGTCVCRR
jgi:uncharacterized protein YlzI (FlbEa/FlbD family)